MWKSLKLLSVWSERTCCVCDLYKMYRSILHFHRGMIHRWCVWRVTGMFIWTSREKFYVFILYMNYTSYVYFYIVQGDTKKQELLKCIVAAMYSWQHCGTGTLSYKQPRHSVIMDQCHLKIRWHSLAPKITGFVHLWFFLVGLP
jgi:hypothetical protein